MQLPILSILKEQNKAYISCVVSVSMKTSSNTMVFFDHQNKDWPALGVEASSLCIGDSNFDPCAIDVSDHYSFAITRFDN
jgi:hypothetical protein